MELIYDSYWDDGRKIGLMFYGEFIPELYDIWFEPLFFNDFLFISLVPVEVLFSYSFLGLLSLLEPILIFVGEIAFYFCLFIADLSFLLIFT